MTSDIEKKVIDLSDYQDEEFDALLFAALSKDAEEEIQEELKRAEQLELPESLKQKVNAMIQEDIGTTQKKNIEAEHQKETEAGTQKDNNNEHREEQSKKKTKIVRLLGSRRFNSVAAAAVVLLIGIFGFRTFVVPQEAAGTMAMMEVATVSEEVQAEAVDEATVYDRAEVSSEEMAGAAAPASASTSNSTENGMAKASAKMAAEENVAAEENMPMMANVDAEAFAVVMSSDVGVDYLEDAELQGFLTGREYEEVVLESGEYESKIVIYSDQELENLKFLSLSLTEIDSVGNVVFDQEELYSLEVLSPENPLVVTLVFHGDSPEYGISYVDEEGITRTFTLTQSGYDGSIVLGEI